MPLSCHALTKWLEMGQILYIDLSAIQGQGLILRRLHGCWILKSSSSTLAAATQLSCETIGKKTVCFTVVPHLTGPRSGVAI